MKSLKARLALAMVAQLFVTTAQAQEAVASGGAVEDATGLEVMTLHWQALSSFQTGLQYGNQKVVEPTTEFLTGGLSWVLEGTADTSSVVMNSVAETYNRTLEAVIDVPDLPRKAQRVLFGNMLGDDVHKFRDLVYETGFALSDVSVGVSLIPHLAISFEHERDLSDEEREEILHQIEEYTQHETSGAGYIEAIVLRNLVRAGTYSGEIDLKGVDVDIFPLPGLSLVFDPVGVLARSETLLDDTAKSTVLALDEITELANRLKKIEAEIFGKQKDEHPESETSAAVTE